MLQPCVLPVIGKLSSIINCKSAFSLSPSNHNLVILGNFNARVGQALSCNDEWSGTRGGYRIGVENESGVELLNYLAQILLLQTPSFRKREFTCKPSSIHVLSCGIA